MTKPSQKALDYAARKAGYPSFKDMPYSGSHSTGRSIVAHAKTLDELWAIKPPKTRGELFKGEMVRRLKVKYESFADIAAQMIDEGWEPKDD